MALAIRRRPLYPADPMNKHFLRTTLLALLATAALVLSACGDDDEGSTDVGDLGPDPATMAPADAPFYGEAVVRPDGEMLDNFNSTLSKFGLDDPGAKLQEALDAELAEDDFSYSEDIEPWLGARVGGFVTDYDPASEMAEGAVAVAVTDEAAAQAFLDKLAETSDEEITDETYEGVDYKFGDGAAIGITEEFLIAGTQQGFEDAIDAGTGDSLAENADATASLEEIPEDALFSAYVDTQAVIDLIESSGELTGAQLQQFEEQVAQYSEGAIEFWGTVGESDVELAFSGPAMTDAPAPSELISTFPAESWLAFASSDVGAQLQTTIDQFEQGFQAGFESAAPSGFSAPSIDPFAEVERATGLDLRTDFDWIGDAGGFVEGSSLFGLGGALVLEATDEQAAADTVQKLQTALSKERSLQISGTDSGFDITAAGAPVGAQVAVEEGQFIFAAGADTVDDVLSPPETLEDSDRFGTAQDALGDDLVPAFYLDFLPVLSLIESSGQVGDDPEYQAAKPYLDALDYVVAGSQIDGDRTIGSFVLGVRDAPEGDEASAAVLTP